MYNFSRLLLCPEEYNYKEWFSLDNIVGHWKESWNGPASYRFIHALIAGSQIVFLPLSFFEKYIAQYIQQHQEPSRSFKVLKDRFNICQIQCRMEAVLYSSDHMLERISYLQRIEKIEVKFWGKKANDYGGLRRQLIHDLLEGIVCRSKILSFEKCIDETFEVYPGNGRCFTIEEQKHLKRLGNFLGLILSTKEKIQSVFSRQFIKLVYLFLIKSDVLDLYNHEDGINPYLTKNELLYRFIKNVLNPIDHHMRGLHQHLLNAIYDDNSVMKSGYAFKMIAGDRDLENAYIKRDITAIRKFICKWWWSYFSLRLQAASLVAQGISERQPIEHIDFKKKSFEVFLNLLQETCDAETIIRRIKIEKINDCLEAKEKKSWVIEWVKKNRKNIAVLRSFVSTITGGSSLVNGIYVEAGSGAHFFIRTCFNKIIIPKECNKEVLFIELDQYGKGHVREFNDL